jgi:hypothetical protein
LARSISNLSFGIGNENEALCYSYEAVALSSDAAQVAQHGRVLLALNLYEQAEEFVKSHRSAMSEALSQHVVALARFARGDESGAFEAAELAVARPTQNVDLGSEITAAWWLIKQRGSLASDAPQESDQEIERTRQVQSDVVAFRDANSYYLVTWPPALRRALNDVKAPKL